MRPGFEQFIPAETTDADETRCLGERLSARLQEGDVIALYGDLGAGKTQLVKGICRGLGIDETMVSSPTFTIVHEYVGEKALYHLDLYRLKSSEEALDLGLPEYMEQDGICLVEWPEVAEPFLPTGTIRIRILHGKGDRRLFEFG